MARFITAAQAAELVRDGDTLGLGGFGSYNCPDALYHALGARFQACGHPQGIATFGGVSPGDNDPESDRGLNAIALKGMIRKAVAGHFANAPRFSKLAAENEFAAYALPLGVAAHLLRATAGHKGGVVTKVGLGTYADPRIEGCKLNEKAREGGDVVERISLGGEEWLFYPAPKLDICFIRASFADEDGNLSVEKEGLTGTELEMAAATHNCGGTVVVQVEKIVPRGSIHPRKVRIHSSLVDYVVVCEDPALHMQNYANAVYDPTLTGEAKSEGLSIAPMPLNVRKIVARRAALELKQGLVINLGIGMPSGVGSVANEEGIAATLSLESGPIGGVPVEGLGFAGSRDPEAIQSLCDTFDLYDGGYLDMTFLGLAEADRFGNVNVSKFGTRSTGPGGFINISQNTPNVFFLGSFTSGKSEISVEDGRLNIRKDGDGVKFRKDVQQITFAASFAQSSRQRVTFITERCVFLLGKNGLILTEIAPGVDLEKHILAKMEFVPEISPDLREMDPRIFAAGRMGLAAER